MSLLYHTRWSLSRGFFNFFLTFFRLGEVVLPLPCTFIIPHLDRFVKGYFEFFLLCSRHNPSFLQLNGSGSHLYPPNLHTLGSRQSAETERGKSYIALVGFGSSPLLSLTSFVPLLYHRGRCLSSTFFLFFQLFFGVDLPKLKILD